MQVFSGLLIGAMLPYWFSAMTMKSVGKAALAMVEEVRRQFATISGLMEGTARPDYRRCVEISTAVRDSLTLLIICYMQFVHVFLPPCCYWGCWPREVRPDYCRCVEFSTAVSD